MGDKTKIEWCAGPDGSLGASWNPVGGCTVASRGCDSCYAAERVAPRQQAQGHPVYDGVVKKSKAGIYRFTGKMTAAPDDHQVWTQPLRWRKPRRIFVCSTSDLFHEHRPIADIDRVFAAMALAPHHRYLLLTKRARVMREYIERKRRSAPEWISLPKAEGKVLLPYEGGWPTYIWLGVSVEDQQRADERIPDLLATPAAMRFLSVEPMLGFVDLRRWMSDWGCERCGYGGAQTADHCINCGWVGDAGPDEFPSCPKCKEFLDDYHGCPECRATNDEGFGPTLSGERMGTIDWVIAGEESGSRARRVNPAIAPYRLRNQCAAAGVPFFWKQSWKKGPIPEGLQIRQWPEAAQQELQEQSHQ